jgi:hypothetical protein
MNTVTFQVNNTVVQSRLEHLEVSFRCNYAPRVNESPVANYLRGGNVPIGQPPWQLAELNVM